MSMAITTLKEEVDMYNNKNIVKYVDNIILTNQLKTKFSECIKKYVRTLLMLEEEGKEVYSIYYDKAGKLLDQIEKELIIEDIETYNKCESFINIANILIEEGTRTKEIECLTTAFFSLKNEFILLGVISKMGS